MPGSGLVTCVLEVSQKCLRTVCQSEEEKKNGVCTVL